MSTLFLSDLHLEDAEPVVAARLREMLVEWLQEGGAERLAGQSRLDDEEVVAELEALGYAAAGEGAESELWNPECTCKHCVHYREQPGTSFDSTSCWQSSVRTALGWQSRNPHRSFGAERDPYE